MNKKITVLPGDGIGPGVIAQARKVMDAINERFGHSFEFDYHGFPNLYITMVHDW